MNHPLHHIRSFSIVAPFTLRITFADESHQTIDFRPILSGALFGPLRDRALFDQVQLDSEAHTLVWPNGADFDPATLHDWPQHASAWIERAREWELATTKTPASRG